MSYVAKDKPLLRVINSVESSDGDGVKIQRIAGPGYSAQLDPFLLLDEIKSAAAADYIGGFPAHPHRGFETITYMLAGQFRHRDHLGNEGVVGPGGAQWMTAGRGVIHSEMPEQKDGLLHGFQLWLNLPAREKLRPAAYRDVAAQETARANLDDGTQVTVIAGALAFASEVKVRELEGPIRTVTEAIIADISLPVGRQILLHLPATCRALVYVINGRTAELGVRQMGVYGDGKQLLLAASDLPTRLLVLAGTPLREPIVQYGPFVMNTPEEINQAIADYQNNQLV